MTKETQNNSVEGVDTDVEVYTGLNKFDVLEQNINEEIARGLLRSEAALYEDDFSNFYNTDLNGKTVLLVEPPYNLVKLEGLCSQNNALAPCVDAMSTNIDGTGYVIEPIGQGAKDSLQTEIEKVEEFFEQPWPGESFVTMRKKLRQDLERTGNAYLEVIRNLQGDVTFLRHVESKTVRFVKLDDAHPTKVKVKRGGVEQEIDMALRERRFVQKIGNTFIYFKEFGSRKVLNKNTGRWAGIDSEPQEVPLGAKAHELLHFGVTKDVTTPYFLPRWINQLPSVIGSRKAEEFNLSYFDSGGVPPVLILVHGGKMAAAAKKSIQNYMADSKSKQRAAVIEAHSSSGSLDGSTGQVRVTVERFGSERQSDSMFEKYDENCEKRVRRSFRLPPLFLGQAGDYSFATAYASYTVAEAQVFRPERDEFDEIINLKLLPELTANSADIRFRSLPLTVKDVGQQLEGLKLVADKGFIDKENYLDTLNQVSGLELMYNEDYDEQMGQIEVARPNTPSAQPEANAEPKGNGTPTQVPARKSESNGIVALAEEAASYINKNEKGLRFQKLMHNISSLSKAEMQVFKSVLATEVYSTNTLVSPDASPELAYDALELLANRDDG